MSATVDRVLQLAKDMASYVHHSGYPRYDGGHTQPEEECQHADCKAVREFLCAKCAAEAPLRKIILSEADPALTYSDEDVASLAELFVREHYDRLRAVKKCTDYRPDHNGECLNCDEPASEHDRCE